MRIPISTHCSRSVPEDWSLLHCICRSLHCLDRTGTLQEMSNVKWHPLEIQGVVSPVWDPRANVTRWGRNILSKEIREFIAKWGVDIRQSSAYYPKSNGRAEAAVKKMKRVIEGNIGPQGSINNDNIMRALLQYRNTPLKTVNKSPAQLLLGRELRDGIPQPTEKYCINPQWENVARLRERTMAAEKLQNKEYHDKSGFKNHQPIAVGQQVVCQNARNKKWDWTGTVVEQRPHRQYIIKVDGSGRTSMRNHIHLKPLLHVRPHTPILSRTNGEAPRPAASTSTSTASATPRVTSGSSTSRCSTSGDSTSGGSASGGHPKTTIADVNNRSARLRRLPDWYGEWVKHWEKYEYIFN